MSLRNSLIICPLFGDLSPYLLAFLDQLIFSSGVHMFASTSSCSLSISILSAINPCFLCFAGGAGAHSSVRLGVRARPSVFLVLSKAFLRILFFKTILSPFSSHSFCIVSHICFSTSRLCVCRSALLGFFTRLDFGVFAITS